LFPAARPPFWEPFSGFSPSLLLREIGRFFEEVERVSLSRWLLYPLLFLGSQEEQGAFSGRTFFSFFPGWEVFHRNGRASSPHTPRLRALRRREQALTRDPLGVARKNGCAPGERPSPFFCPPRTSFHPSPALASNSFDFFLQRSYKESLYSGRRVFSPRPVLISSELSLFFFSYPPFCPFFEKARLLSCLRHFPWLRSGYPPLYLFRGSIFLQTRNFNQTTRFFSLFFHPRYLLPQLYLFLLLGPIHFEPFLRVLLSLFSLAEQIKVF